MMPARRKDGDNRGDKARLILGTVRFLAWLVWIFWDSHRG